MATSDLNTSPSAATTAEYQEILEDRLSSIFYTMERQAAIREIYKEIFLSPLPYENRD